MKTTLHPSNPYYNSSLSSYYDQQAAPLLEPYEPTPAPAPNPQRSVSVDNVALPSELPQSKSPTERPRNMVTYRTRSIGGPFCPGVYFERQQIDLSPPNDDEIIIATVRVTNSFRRASVEGCAELPSRPPPRSYLRRLSSRMTSPTDGSKYTAIKMPRHAYKTHFARDKDGNYAGTEQPEREWSREDLDKMFGEYQDLPLRSIPGGSEYGEPGVNTEWDREFRVPNRRTKSLWDNQPGTNKAGGFGEGADGGRPLGVWRVG